MKKIIVPFIYFLLLSHSFSFGQNVSKNFFDGEVYVKIKNEVPFVFNTTNRDVEIKSKLPFLIPLMSRYNITKAEASFYFSKSNGLKRTFRIHFGKSELVDKLIAEIKNIPQIEYAEKIPVMRIVYTPNDLLANQFTGQYALYNIHAQDAWDVTRGDNSVMVAVVDNAIDINHPDLSGNITHPWDLANADNDPSPPNSNSAWEHGTHTSGIAGAVTDNGTGIASIGFHCGLMPIKATSDFSSDPTIIDFGYEGIDWAVLNGAKVISCSWGGTSSLTGQLSILDAYLNDVIVVAAAGNDNNNTTNYPAGFAHVVAVAAVDSSDTKSGFSNFGSWVDVSAPGSGILSTLPGNNYGQLWGTSMAAPMVAGLCGLIRSLNPGLSYDDVVSILVNSCDNIDAKNPGFIGQLGSGRINAYRAVESALTCNPSINLGSGVYTILKTESSGSITSANTIPVSTQVTLDAASIVDLLPGFVASNGSVFRAYIDGCGNSFFSNYYNNKKGVKSDKVSITENGKESINSLSVNSLEVFPNPASSIIHVRYQLRDATNVALHLYNSNGALVYQDVTKKKLTGVYDLTINVSKFAAGVYFMEFKTDKEVKMVSIIVLH